VALPQASLSVLDQVLGSFLSTSRAAAFFCQGLGRALHLGGPGGDQDGDDRAGGSETGADEPRGPRHLFHRALGVNRVGAHPGDGSPGGPHRTADRAQERLEALLLLFPFLVIGEEPRLARAADPIDALCLLDDVLRPARLSGAQRFAGSPGRGCGAPARREREHDTHPPHPTAPSSPLPTTPPTIDECSHMPGNRQASTKACQGGPDSDVGVGCRHHRRRSTLMSNGPRAGRRRAVSSLPALAEIRAERHCLSLGCARPARRGDLSPHLASDRRRAGPSTPDHAPARRRAGPSRRALRGPERSCVGFTNGAPPWRTPALRLPQPCAGSRAAASTLTAVRQT